MSRGELELVAVDRRHRGPRRQPAQQSLGGRRHAHLPEARGRPLREEEPGLGGRRPAAALRPRRLRRRPLARPRGLAAAPPGATAREARGVARGRARARSGRDLGAAGHRGHVRLGRRGARRYRSDGEGALPRAAGVGARDGGDPPRPPRRGRLPAAAPHRGDRGVRGVRGREGERLRGEPGPAFPDAQGHGAGLARRGSSSSSRPCRCPSPVLRGRRPPPGQEPPPPCRALPCPPPRSPPSCARS